MAFKNNLRFLYSFPQISPGDAILDDKPSLIVQASTDVPIVSSSILPRTPAQRRVQAVSTCRMISLEFGKLHTKLLFQRFVRGRVRSPLTELRAVTRFCTVAAAAVSTPSRSIDTVLPLLKNLLESLNLTPHVLEQMALAGGAKMSLLWRAALFPDPAASLGGFSWLTDGALVVHALPRYLYPITPVPTFHRKGAGSLGNGLDTFKLPTLLTELLREYERVYKDQSWPHQGVESRQAPVQAVSEAASLQTCLSILKPASRDRTNLLQPHRLLTWVLEQGSAVLAMHTTQGSYDILVSTLQMLVLLQLSAAERMSWKQLLDGTLFEIVLTFFSFLFSIARFLLIFVFTYGMNQRPEQYHLPWMKRLHL
jgi:hypothetical protein